MAQNYYEDNSKSRYDDKSDPIGTKRRLDAFEDREKSRKHFNALTRSLWSRIAEFHSYRHPLYRGIEEDGDYHDWYKTLMHENSPDLNNVDYDDSNDPHWSKEVYEPKIGDDGIEDQVALDSVLKFCEYGINILAKINKDREEAARLDESADDDTREEEDEQDEDEQEDKEDSIRTTWVTARHIILHESLTPPTSATLDDSGVTPLASADHSESVRDAPTSSFSVKEAYAYATSPIKIKLTDGSLKYLNYLASHVSEPAASQDANANNSADLTSATLSSGTMVAEEPSPELPPKRSARRGSGRPRKSGKGKGKGKGKRKRNNDDDVAYRPDIDDDEDADFTAPARKRPRRSTRRSGNTKDRDDDYADGA
ncbi:hypothetical protein F4779DRAFT_599593 [Xylariaceae sp. FL0662B]|nr:hypothetical protein F4779DRAFT_599593 [Xylariaceae sp. FL0662B]